MTTKTPEPIDFDALITGGFASTEGRFDFVNRIKASTIVFSDKVREYCILPYPRHPKGCPNFGKNPFCPPKSMERRDIIQKYSEFYLVIAVFDMKKYLELMRARHPDWSDIQLRNVLYWQNSVKNKLKSKILDSGIQFNEVFGSGSGFMQSQSMESAGINVFATLQRNKIGFDLKARERVTLVALLCKHKHRDLFSFVKERAEPE